MNKLCHLILVLTLFVLRAEAKPETNASFSVLANIKTTNGQLYLDLVLTNSSTMNLEVPLGYLPWNRYAMSLVVVPADGAARPLKQVATIADPPPGAPHMLCAKCQQKEAEVDITNIVEGTSEETVHFCKECAPHISFDFNTLSSSQIQELSVLGKKCEFCSRDAFSGEI